MFAASKETIRINPRVRAKAKTAALKLPSSKRRPSTFDLLTEDRFFEVSKKLRDSINQGQEVWSRRRTRQLGRTQ